MMYDLPEHTRARTFFLVTEWLMYLAPARFGLHVEARSGAVQFEELRSSPSRLQPLVPRSKRYPLLVQLREHRLVQACLVQKM
mmetsp:Transcript_28761/g.95554  ORF Transcript_28761/g.95554 Transcript_28761/m.95554 type:complete len:83 (+) Transcript_28761:200-448(+)